MDDDFDANTDSEEEAFVNQLAEKLMESSGNGKANLDDEDPDMDDWSDFDDDSDDDNQEGGNDKEVDFTGAAGNEDAFMDAPSSDEDFEGGAYNDGGGSFDDDDDEDDNFPMMLGDGEDFSDDDDSDAPTQGKYTDKKKKAKFDSIYADADEYEKILQEEIEASNNPQDAPRRKKKKRKTK